MNFAKIQLFDVANGSGIRVSLFLSGCKFHCKGCFNKDAQKFDFGKPFTETEYNIILDKLKDENWSGLSLLGGDPLWQDKEGLHQLLNLINDVHKLGKDVWIWSGFTWEEIFSLREGFEDSLRQTIVKKCDVFIDGRFELENKKLDLIWKGSTNQRVIDVQKSLKVGSIVELNF